MINSIPPILYILTTYGIYKYVGRFFCLSVYIWLLHTVSMICFWIKADLFTGFPNDYSYEALAVMYVTLLLITYRMIVFDKKGWDLGLLTPTNNKKVLLLSKFLILLGIYSIAFFVVNLPKVFAQNIAELRDERMVFYSSSFFSKVAVLGAFASVFCIYFYFYLSTLKDSNKYKRTKNWLLISSTSFIVYTLNVAGRDGIVIWGLSFLGGVFLFHRNLDNISLRNIWKKTLVAFLLTAPILGFITSSRFSNGYNDNSAIESVFSYAGQSLPNLSYAIDLTRRIGIYSGEGSIPIALVRSIMGDNEDRFDRMERTAGYGFRSNQFASYVSAFYPAYPVYVLFLFVILFNIVIAGAMRGKMDYTRFLPAFTWYMIPIVGIFYFYYGELIGNVFLIMPFFIRYYLRN